MRGAGARPRWAPPPRGGGAGRSGAGVSQSGNNVPPPAPGFAAAWAGAAPWREGLLGDRAAGNGERLRDPAACRPGEDLGARLYVRPGGDGVVRELPTPAPSPGPAACQGAAGRCWGPGAARHLALLRGWPRRPAGAEPPPSGSRRGGPRSTAARLLQPQTLWGFIRVFLFSFVLPRKRLINNAMSRKGRKAPGCISAG